MDKPTTYIYPGTVFTAKNYDPFTKKVLSHPFVCIYDQALDEETQGETNCLALLITSNNKQSSRQVPILKARNPYLDKDSFCYCNNIYMFLKNDCNIIGQLDSDTFFAIIKKRQALLRGENDQCVQALMNMKTYEYKQKRRASDEAKRKRDDEEAAALKAREDELKRQQQALQQQQNKPSKPRFHFFQKRKPRSNNSGSSQNVSGGLKPNSNQDSHNNSQPKEGN